MALAGLYARYSLQLTAGANPLIWAAVMGLLVDFVAYERYALKPQICFAVWERRAGGGRT